MAAISITKDINAIRKLFNRIHSVGYIAPSGENWNGTPPSSVSAITCMLPILASSVTFDTGKPEITEVKLTTGEKWTTMMTAGEASISMQCSSYHEFVNSLFLTEKVSTETTLGASGSTLEGVAYSGKGYSTEAKKVTGSLVLRDESKESVIYLPNVEIFASVGVEEDKPGYFDLQVTPLADANGASIYFLHKVVG